MQRVQRCCYDCAAQTIVAPTLVQKNFMNMLKQDGKLVQTLVDYLFDSV